MLRASYLNPSHGNVDLRKVAVSLVERRRRFNARWKLATTRNNTDIINERRPEVFDNSEIVSFFPAKFALDVVRHGQLNYHQTGNTLGTQLDFWRAVCEETMIGLRLSPVYKPSSSDRSNFLRPKYGLVNFLSYANIPVDPQSILRYGEVIVVYRDEVKWRTTYTYGDSMDALVWRTSVEEPELLINGLADYATPKSACSQTLYVEAQIWGPLDVTDVQEFRIPSDKKLIAQELKTAGLPIFTYDRLALEKRSDLADASYLGLKALECVYAGDPIKMRKYDSLRLARLARKQRDYCP
jgi:hypothetical protein